MNPFFGVSLHFFQFLRVFLMQVKLVEVFLFICVVFTGLKLLRFILFQINLIYFRINHCQI